MAQRKIPGNLSFDDIRKLGGRGYVPKVKIHLQELQPGGKAGGVFRELTRWQSVSINRQLSGRGRATISLANVDDKHFDNFAERMINPNKIQMTKGYLTDLHRRVLGQVKEVNPNRRRGNTLDFQGLRSFDEDDVQAYVKFLYNFDGIDGGKSAQKGGGKPDLPALGLAQRVIIDAQGPDGAWYALFTGIVSSIEDRFTSGDIPTIDVVCLDYWRLFDLSEIVVRTGVDPIIDNLQLAASGSASDATYKSNTLADYSGAQVLQIIMDIVQRTMCWIPYALSKIGQQMPIGKYDLLQQVPSQTFSQQVPDTVNLGGTLTFTSSRENFFNDEPFWRIPIDLSRPAQGRQEGAPLTDVDQKYEGHDCLRHYAKAPQYLGPAQDKKDGDEPTDGMPVGQLYSTLLIDKYIKSITQATPYLLYIQSFLQPWQANRTLGSSIIRRVAEASFYDVFLTPNGDVVYQIPKYNNCPGEYVRKGSSTSSASGAPTPAPLSGTTPTLNATLGLDSVTGKPIQAPGSLNPAQLAAQDNGNGVLPPDTQLNVGIGDGGFVILAAQTSNADPPTDPSFADGDYDYAPQPENYAQKNHGFNHVLTNVGVRGWRLSSSEEGLVTTVRVPFGMEYINEFAGAPSTPKLQTGRTPISETKDIVARFGLRVFEAQQMNVKKLFEQSNPQEIMNTFALALLQQINGRSFGGSFDLSIRMDLDLGKNIFHIERQKLLYIIGLTHTIRQGQDAQTSLQLGYGHDISREIISPLASIRNLNGVASGGTTSSSAGTSSGGAQAATPGQVSGGTPAAPSTDASAGSGVVGSGGAVGTAPLNNFATLAQPWPQSYYAKTIAPLQAAYSKTKRNVTLIDISPSVISIPPKERKLDYIDTAAEIMRQSAERVLRQQPGFADASLSIDEYALARMLAQETAELSNVIEMVLCAQVVNNASSSNYRRLTVVTNYAITSGKFGRQTLGRKASTFKDATLRTLLVVKSVKGGLPPIIPRLGQFYGLGPPLAEEKKKGVPIIRKVMLKWTNPNTTTSTPWVGPIDGIDSATRHIFFRNQVKNESKDVLRQQQKELIKLLDSLGVLPLAT